MDAMVASREDAMSLTVQTRRVVDNESGHTVAILSDADHGRITVSEPHGRILGTVEDDNQAIHALVTSHLS
jgi:hypothetical protein